MSKIRLAWTNNERGVFLRMNADGDGVEAEAMLDAVEMHGCLSAEIARLEHEIQPWKREALAALQLDEPYRGGGVLKLAELMRRLSWCIGHRAAMRQWPYYPKP